MSLRVKILRLLSDIDDPSLRLEISRTIMFLFEVWRSGNASEEEVLSSLYEIAYTVVSYKEPLLMEEDKRNKAREIAEDLMRSFKMESLFPRMFRKMRAITF